MDTNERLALVKAINEQDDKVLICDKCNHEFKLKKAKHKRRKIGEYQGEIIREVYFNCPSKNCDADYHVTYETRSIKAIKAKMRRLVRMVKSRQAKGDVHEIDGLKREYFELQNELKSKISVIGRLYGNG